MEGGGHWILSSASAGRLWSEAERGQSVVKL